jgi:hypothetical protein
VTSPRKPSRPLVRALALAMLAIVVAGFSAGTAWAATSVGANTPTMSASQLAEALRRYRQQSSTKAAAPATGANGATPGGANTPTTTSAPSGGAAAPGGAAAAATPTTATPSAPPAHATAPSNATASGGERPLSTGAVVIAVLAALLVLACLIWAFARSRAFEPHWLVALRHSAAEAGFRASATWSELLDWARLGR